jgi:quercetin dioxygenase-like cupin family protein
MAYLVNWKDIERFDVMGPTIQFLTSLTGEPDSPCIMRGTVPPGVIIPLHSHADPETFIQLSGELEGLSESASGLAWMRIRPGDIFHVPGGAKHAFRNHSTESAVSMIVSTCRLGSFLRSIGTSQETPHASSVSPERIRHFLTTSEKFGYWNASPEENARFGLHLPPSTE